eukprot:gene7696-9008_t
MRSKSFQLSPASILMLFKNATAEVLDYVTGESSPYAINNGLRIRTIVSGYLDHLLASSTPDMQAFNQVERIYAKTLTKYNEAPTYPANLSKRDIGLLRVCHFISQIHTAWSSDICDHQLQTAVGHLIRVAMPLGLINFMISQSYMAKHTTTKIFERANTYDVIKYIIGADNSRVSWGYGAIESAARRKDLPSVEALLSCDPFILRDTFPHETDDLLLCDDETIIEWIYSRSLSSCISIFSMTGDSSVQTLRLFSKHFELLHKCILKHPLPNPNANLTPAPSPDVTEILLKHAGLHGYLGTIQYIYSLGQSNTNGLLSSLNPYASSLITALSARQMPIVQYYHKTIPALFAHSDVIDSLLQDTDANLFDLFISFFDASRITSRLTSSSTIFISADILIHIIENHPEITVPYRANHLTLIAQSNRLDHMSKYMAHFKSSITVALLQKTLEETIQRGSIEMVDYIYHQQTIPMGNKQLITRLLEPNIPCCLPMIKYLLNNQLITLNRALALAPAHTKDFIVKSHDFNLMSQQPASNSPKPLANDSESLVFNLCCKQEH